MNESSPTHMPWCTDHRGDLCVSKTWTVAGVRLFLYGCETDVPPTAIHFGIGPYGVAYHAEEASRLSEALAAAGMLAGGSGEESVDYWTARLNILAERDRVAS